MIRNQLDKDVANLNATNFEQSTKLLGSGLESLSKSLTAVVNHAFAIASNVNQTIVELSQISVEKGEPISQIKSSVNKVINAKNVY